jgi:hypothetical protein
MSVLAPLSSSNFTPSTSPAFTAKNRACMGTLQRLGSAPRRSSSWMVSQRLLCLQGPTQGGYGWEGRCKVIAKTGSIRMGGGVQMLPGWNTLWEGCQPQKHPEPPYLVLPEDT